MARLLTFLVVDLVGSSGTLARLGEARLAGARRGYLELVRAAGGSCEGREFALVDDAIILAFDAPSDAVACAVAIQQACGRQNSPAHERLDVRIGLQVGEALEGEHRHEREQQLGGPLLEAWRLCQAALGGQILASSLVQALATAREGACFCPVGLLELRGVAEPISVYDVTYEHVRHEQLPLPPELAGASSQLSAFVGRSEERERLGCAWRLAESGERQLAFISGEPGIGKSRLAGELARELHGGGAVVLWGRCFEEAITPYQPFVQALRHYAEHCDADELVGVAAQAAPLARLLPELAARVPSTRGADEIEPETERYRLFEAIAAMLGQVALQAPLLLVLDDLQWADQGTLLLLRSLVLDARPVPMLVLGTYRDSEVPRAHPLAKLHADVLRDRPVEVVELAGLGEEESAQLVDGLLGWSLPADVARTLRGETEGNPFFLEEVVRHLEGLGIVSDPERMRQGPITADELGVPRRVKELVARRVQRLSPSALEALQIASVISSEFRVDVLAAVLAAPEGRVVELLDAAVEARLLAELPERIGEYGFTHALIQQALYEELGANRRASLHEQIGHALEALHPDDVAALAHHFGLAGERSRAKVVGYGRAAGERALALLAYEDAGREFGRALTALTLVGDEQGERAELLVLLGSARRRAGDAEAAEAAFAEAAELAGRRGEATTLARAALGYGGGTGFGGVWTKFARVDTDLVGFLKRAVALLPADDRCLRVQLQARLAQALYWGTPVELEQALELSEQALALARTLDDPVALAHALDARHAALWQPENLEELTPIAEEMLRLGSVLGDREIQLQAYAWLITDALESEPIETVDRYLEGHARLAAELQQPYHLWFMEAARAMRAGLAGCFTEMGEAVERARRYGETAHGETAQAVALVQLQQLRLDSGGGEQSIEPLEQLAAASPLPATRSLLVRAYADADREAEALEQVGWFGGGEFDAVRRDCVWSSTICFLGEAVARFDAADHAPALYRLLLPFADRNLVAGGGILCLGPVSRYLGMLARVNGEYERALQHLRHALVRSRALGSEPLVLRTKLENAHVRLARGAEGDDELARGLLAEVRAGANLLGMAPLARDVSRLEQPTTAGAQA